MANYFKYFPKFTYDDEVVRDITKRPKFLDDLARDPYTLLPYTIKEGETPHEISNLYYGSPIFVWLIYLANNMLDPYHDWPLTTLYLERTIIEKYRDLAQANAGTAFRTSRGLSSTDTLSDRDVLEWTQYVPAPSEQSNVNNTDNKNVLYYYNAEGNKITSDTFFFSGQDKSGWFPRRIYDEEDRLNEAKRDIVLINKEYRDLAIKNLKDAMRS